MPEQWTDLGIPTQDIYNYVVEFSGDQQGSRFIQTKLETANSDEKDRVFREIEPNAVQLMKDLFGNYVIQKFFEHGNQVQKKILAGQMKGRMVDLSTQVYACRVVQKVRLPGDRPRGDPLLSPLLGGPFLTLTMPDAGPRTRPRRATGRASQGTRAQYS